ISGSVFWKLSTIMTAGRRTLVFLQASMESRMTDTNKNPDAKPADPELHPAPLAYLNPEFLASPDGRILRILSEYAEPLARFRREKIQDTVVFFGSARFAGLSEETRPCPGSFRGGSAPKADRK